MEAFAYRTYAAAYRPKDADTQKHTVPLSTPQADRHR